MWTFYFYLIVNECPELMKYLLCEQVFALSEKQLAFAQQVILLEWLTALLEYFDNMVLD